MGNSLVSFIKLTNTINKRISKANKDAIAVNIRRAHISCL